MRIVRNRAKFLYIVVAFAVPGILLSNLQDASSGALTAFWTLLALVVSTTAIWLATRWFRVLEVADRRRAESLAVSVVADCSNG